MVGDILTTMTTTTTTTAHVLPLTAAAATEVAHAGGKGAMLAQLLQAGLPIPIGCVLTPRALTTYLKVQAESAPTTAAMAAQVLRHGTVPSELATHLCTVLTTLGPAPHGWAVRSSTIAEDSVTASFAGVYESYLDIPETELWDAIRLCWLSWWSDRAMVYRQQLEDTATRPAMAVVIQHMVPAHSAGVAFTVDPISGDPTRMVINAAPGLGVTVVSGMVEPEHYTLSKTPDVRVIDRRLIHPDQPPLLTPNIVADLGHLLSRIEALCHHPQDVEWAWDGTRAWIVQSRPITTLGAQSDGETPDIWTNANLKDVIPGLVSTLCWSLTRPQLETVMRQQYARLNYTWSPERSVTRRFWGRAYFNMSLFQQAGYDVFGAAPSDQHAQLGGIAVEGFTPTPPKRVSLRQRGGWLYNYLRFMRFLNRLHKQLPAHFTQQQQHWERDLPRIPHLERAPLLDEIVVRQELDASFLLLHLDVSWGMNGHFMMLSQLIKQHVPQAPDGLMADLVTGLGEVSSAEHSYQLWELSRVACKIPEVMTFLQQREWSAWPTALADTPFVAPWQTFLNTYGHRGIYEVDLSNPRWREQPDYLFDVIATYTTMDQDTPPFNPQEQTQRRQAAGTFVLHALPWWRRFWFRTTLRRTQEFSRWREQSKSHLVQLVDLGRQYALRAATFLVQDGVLSAVDDIFFLELEEVVDALKGNISAATIQRRMAQRRRERQRYAALQPPDVIVGDQPLYTNRLTQDDSALSGLSGLPSSPGRVRGTARVLRSPQEAARLQAGDILIAPSTDPGWTPLFLLAAGLVMETGGYLSHGSIVAREYGIPAVINVPLATQRIPDGSTVILDGGAGTVHIQA